MKASNRLVYRYLLGVALGTVLTSTTLAPHAGETTALAVGLAVVLGLLNHVLGARHERQWTVGNLYAPPAPPFLLRFHVLVIIGLLLFFLLQAFGDSLSDHVRHNYLYVPVILGFTLSSATSVLRLLRFESRHGPVYWHEE
jgi:hypothetical protein